MTNMRYGPPKVILSDMSDYILPIENHFKDKTTHSHYSFYSETEEKVIKLLGAAIEKFQWNPLDIAHMMKVS